MDTTRWLPFGEMGPFRGRTDRFFDEPLPRPFRVFDLPPVIGGLPLDIYEEADRCVVEAGLPGFKPGDVEAQLQGNTLTISGRMGRPEEQPSARNYLIRERVVGQITRSVTLPVEVDAEKCEATLDNGVLRLVLPKTSAHQPKRIAIRSNQGGHAGEPEGSGEKR